MLWIRNFFSSDSVHQLRKAGLKMNPDKCIFGATEVSFLGHKVGRDEVKPNDNLIKKIKEYHTDQSKKCEKVRKTDLLFILIKFFFFCLK